MDWLKLWQQYGVFTILGSLLGLVLFVINWRKDLRKISIHFTARKLFDQDFLPNPDLKLTLKDKILPYVWVHEIRLTNIGKKDLPISAFQGNVMVECDSIVSASISTDVVPDIKMNESDKGLELVPFLLKRGEQVSILIATESKAQPICNPRFLDFDVTLAPNKSWWQKNSDAIRFATSGTLVVVVAVLLLDLIIPGRNLVLSNKEPKVTVNTRPTNIQFMYKILLIPSLIRSRIRQSGTAVLPPFDTQNLPSWANGPEAIVAWGGPPYDLSLLEEHGISVKLSPSAENKSWDSLTSNDTLLIISDKSGIFPYTRMTFDEKFLR